MAKHGRRKGAAGADPVARVETAIADAVEIAATAGLRLGSPRLLARLRQAFAISTERSGDGPEEA